MDRETRSFDLNRVEVREKAGQVHFRGHAAVFDSPTEIGMMTEVVRKGAFARALQEGQDVLFTIDHNPEKLLARTSSGTLKLKEDQKGLAVEATFPDTSYARDAAELVSRGDLSGMSFVFSAQQQSWEGNQRSLEDVDLYDVSLVALPAYKDTNVDIQMRKVFDALTEARSGKSISAKNRQAIEEAIATLTSLISQEEEVREEDLSPRRMSLALLEKYGA
ncbi:MAG TPA: HK97 family phage prohead protease [Nitrososphaera sp.]